MAARTTEALGFTVSPLPVCSRPVGILSNSTARREHLPARIIPANHIPIRIFLDARGAVVGRFESRLRRLPGRMNHATPRGADQ